jgi:hypothetical protein
MRYRHNPMGIVIENTALAFAKACWDLAGDTFNREIFLTTQNSFLSRR